MKKTSKTNIKLNEILNVISGSYCIVRLIIMNVCLYIYSYNDHDAYLHYCY